MASRQSDPRLSTDLPANVRKEASIESGSRLVSVDRLTRQQQVVEGVFKPTMLGELADFLASSQGHITYRFSGNTESDQSGSQQKRLECIISGWFEVRDAITLAPSRFSLDIKSRLVVVASEAELPPLEVEAEDEDYIVCGQDFDIGAHVQEEILLALPTSVPRNVTSRLTPEPKAVGKFGQSNAAGDPDVSPFAKLAALKKSR